MSEPAPKVRVTPEALARMREEAAASRARHEAAWTRAASAPVPAAATRSEPERLTRSLALGFAALAAFLPSALLADGSGRVVGAGAAAKNTLVVLLLTLVPALVAARSERAPESEDTSSSRFALRFSPGAVGILLALALPLAWLPTAVLRWHVVEVGLVLQAAVALYLHVPRARACHVFCVLWGALASTVIDERAAPGLGVAFALVVFAAVLDRSLDVRVALGPGAPATSSEPRAAIVGVVLGVFALLFGGAFWLVHGLEPRLPALETQRLGRAVVEKGPSTVDLVLTLAAVVLTLGAYHLIFGRLERNQEGAGDPDEETQPPAVLETLSPEPATVPSSWPLGARRTLVERYLAHLARLASLGARRSPAQAPLEIADAVGERAPGVLERARRLARGFHAARYSPDEVLPEAAESAARDAGEIEGLLAAGGLASSALDRRLPAAADSDPD